MTTETGRTTTRFRLSQEMIAIVTVGVALAGLRLFTIADLREDRAAWQAERQQQHAAWEAESRQYRDEVRSAREAFQRETLRITETHPKLAGAAPFEAPESTPNANGLEGTWTAYDDKGLATEVRITDHSASGTSGTVCYVRKDGAVAFFDFAPGARIEGQTKDDRVEVVRAPFKAKMTHRIELIGDGQLHYKERVHSKPWRLTLKMQRGAAEDGCIRRIRPPRG